MAASRVSRFGSHRTRAWHAGYVSRRGRHGPHGARGRRRRDDAPPAIVVDRPLEALQAPAPALLDAQGARAAPVRARAPTTSCTRSTTSSFDVGQGEFFGIVGPQRLRQEHAAQVPRRHLRDRRRAMRPSRGRLSPFIELGVGFNPDLTARDNVIINAIMLGLTRKRGARALRRDHRVRRARGVPRPQAQELLVGHERAARVLASRSRSTPTCCSSTRCSPSATPPSSRSASTQFHRLKDDGQDDRLRHPRHERRRALLRPGDAARARQDRRDRRAARGRARVQRAQLRRGSPPGGGDGERSATSAPPRSQDAWFEDGARRAGHRRSAQGEPLRAVRRGRASTSRSSDPVFALPAAQRGPPHDLRDLDRPARRATPAPSRRATRRSSACALENWLAPGRYDAHADARPRAAAAADALDVREDLRVVIVARRRAARGGVVELPHTHRASSAA